MTDFGTWSRRACLSLLAGVTAAAANAQAQASDPMRAFDLNNDDVLDIAEVRTAAAARFDEMNPDGDDALDPREAAPAMTAEQFRQADKQNRGVITKAEYLAYVERMFLQADPDGDGALYRADLETGQGQIVLRLIGR